VASRATDRPDYLRPGRLIEPAWLPGVRFYVLGPPPSREKLRKLGTDASPELYRTAPDLSRAFGVTTQFMASGRKADAHVARLSEEERVAFERQFPFDREFRLPRTGPAHRRWMGAYEKPDAQWRRIDRDYLGTATDLALQLDNQTNNTSLVLAMEFVADGRVLLFPADAQLGNWLSWHDEAIRWSVTRDDGTTTIVTARDLLRRTVFYKVGHHSSHNATINALGLELMTSAELVAVIPVDGLVAGRKQWKMPATALYQRLLEKTSGRVVRSDTLWPTDADRPASIPLSTWTAARRAAPIEIDPGGLFVDYILR